MYYVLFCIMIDMVFFSLEEEKKMNYTISSILRRVMCLCQTVTLNSKRIARLQDFNSLRKISLIHLGNGKHFQLVLTFHGL